MNRKTGFLLLDDGTIFTGKIFGALPPGVEELGALKEGRCAGEVVFNTGMCGYHEIMTDPSYTGQLVTMTYPLIGNYGTDDSWSETHPSSNKTGMMVKAGGLIIRNLYDGPVSEGRTGLEEYLKENRTSGLCEVDTRALTLKIRKDGMPRGVLVSSEVPNAETLTIREKEKGVKFLNEFPEMTGRNLVPGQDVGDFEVHNPDGHPHIALVDCGIKENIIRQLIQKGCRLTVCPHNTESVKILELESDGVLISNGPGDPAVLAPLIRTVRELIGKLPLFGICLGHQIISLSIGGVTKKMRFGHHGVNNPVKDERTGRVWVTSQNHGFMVEEESLPDNIRIWFRNANDGTVEGIISDDPAVATAQFHPESAPGPEDTFWIFREFLKIIERRTI